MLQPSGIPCDLLFTLDLAVAFSCDTAPGIGSMTQSHPGIGSHDPFPSGNWIPQSVPSIHHDCTGIFLVNILGSSIILDSHRHSSITDSPIHITVVDDPGIGSMTQSYSGIGSHDSFPNPQVL